MRPLPLSHLGSLSEAYARWEGTTFTGICEFHHGRATGIPSTNKLTKCIIAGTWAQYLAKKVKKVFPDLPLGDFEHNAKPSTRFTLAVQG